MRPWRGAPPHGCGPNRRGYHHGNLKEALVEAARRFIAERGLGGFTLVDAARLVGVSPAALYRHFRGREDLVAEVAGRGFAELAERLARALRGPGTPIERFTRLGEAYLTFAEEEPGYYAAIFAPGAASGGPARDANAFEILVDALRTTFPDGFNGVDPRFIALEVWSLSHGIATLAAAGRLPPSPTKHELLRAGVLALVHGAGPK